MKHIELHYFPQAAYIAALMQYPDLKIDGYEHFVKQTYRNRCRIITPNGIDTLSVPVKGSGKIISKDIRIDHSQKWLNRHWRAIQSAYGRAPFFEYYIDEFKAILDKRHVFLFDLSAELLTQCLEFLQFDRKLEFTTAYHELTEQDDLDLRNSISPKSNENKLIKYNPAPYHQVFGNNFVEELSVIDLLFCEGPQSGERIRSAMQ